jgi:redox-sensitive bicupin YhaK (pirin superfamily)
MSEGTTLSHTLEPDQGVYLYLISGSVEVNDEKLGTGDAAEISGEPELRFRASEPAELIAVEVRLSTEG